MYKIDKINKYLETNGYEPNKLLKLSTGINSTTYKLENNSESYVLKIYNDNNKNNLKRLNNEKNFLMFLNRYNFKNVPKFILGNNLDNWILISWISGEKIKSINYYKCKELLDFLDSIQKFRESSGSEKLLLASDAYFTLDELVLSIDKRISILLNKKEELININKILSKNLNNFIDQIQKNFLDAREFAKTYDIDLKYYLPKKERIISPSDVGFHNIIYRDNKSYFIDFEYAGWDDPSKLFCDLVLQPDHNIPMKYIDVLNNFFKKYIFKVDFKKNRLLFMLKLYRLKWSLIILNSIVNSNHDPQVNFKSVLDTKLNKSLNYLNNSSLRINFIDQNFLNKY